MMQIAEKKSIPHKWYSAIGLLLQNMSLKVLLMLFMPPSVSKADRSGHCGNNSHPRDK